MNQSYERVYAVTAYVDGILQGVADFAGRPHVYELDEESEPDEACPTYRLSVLPDELLPVARELWETGRRLNRADPASEAALAQRVEALYAQLEAALALDESSELRARGDFRPAADGPDDPKFPELEVEWSSQGG